MSWYKNKKFSQNGIVVYQGRFANRRYPSNFYSLDRDFAADYGEVKEYLLTSNNIFDSSNSEHIKLLFDRVGPITDSYDDRVFNTSEEYMESDLPGFNTWESIEPFIGYIKAMGFNAMKIYEGGIENYYVMYPQQDITPI